MTIKKSDFLDVFPYFRNTTEALVDEIITSSKCRSAQENIVLKKEGAEITDFVFLLSGEKRVYKKSESGREITLYEIGPGDICVLNATCLLSNSRLPANAVSLSKVVMLIMPSSAFHYILTRYDEFRSFIFSRINISLVSVMSLIVEITFGRMDERLNDYLTEKSENCKLMITHQKIANDLGTSREVVSRLLKEGERRGLYRLSRNCIEINTL